jgi:hypothetical protein
VILLQKMSTRGLARRCADAVATARRCLRSLAAFLCCAQTCTICRTVGLTSAAPEAFATTRRAPRASHAFAAVFVSPDIVAEIRKTCGRAPLLRRGHSWHQ